MAEKPRPIAQDLGNLPQLQPQAQPRDTYVRPGQVEYGRPAETNPMLQLSQALSSLEPTLNRAVGMAAEQYSAEEVAKGERDFLENRDKWNALIRAGKLPEGASPYYTRGLQRASLKQLGAEFQSQMLSAFHGPEGAEARNSDDPAAMTALLHSTRKSFMDTKLKDGDRHLFQGLDVQDIFNPMAEQGYKALMQTHATYRVAEREKEYEATVSREMTNALTSDLEFITPRTNDVTRKESYKQSALKLNDALYNPDYGAVRNGMLPSKGNDLMVDTVVAQAIRTGDRKFLDVLDYVTNKDGASIGNTKYAVAKRIAAEEHITSTEMQREHFQHWKAGLPFEEASKQHTQQSWQREDERYAREMEAYHAKRRDISNDEDVKTFERRIFEGLRRDGETGPVIIDEAMKELEVVNPEKAAYMRGVIHTITKQKTDYEDDPLTVALLRTDMNTNPLSFSNGRLVDAVKEKKLKSSTMMQMMDDLERNRQNGDHPLMRQPEFLGMLDQVKKGSLRNANDEYGAEGALRSADSTGEFRDLALTWIEDNPNGSEAKFRSYMRSQIRDVIERNNAEFGQEQKNQREQQTKAGERIRDTTSATVGEAEQKKKDQADAQRKKDEQKATQQKFQDEISTGQRTKEGRKILRLDKNTIETEKTITVTDDRINDGRPTNIPTIFDGKHVSEDEAINIIAKNKGVDPDTGRKLRGYYRMADAEIAARERSARLGKEYGDAPGYQPEKPKPTATAPSEKALQALRDDPSPDNQAAFIKQFGAKSLPTDLVKKSEGGSTTSKRFVVDGGEIVDTKMGEIIPVNAFNKRATAEEKDEVERLLRESGHMIE